MKALNKSAMFLIIGAVIFILGSNIASAAQLASVDVGEVIGNENAELVYQTLDAVSAVLGELNVMIQSGYFEEHPELVSVISDTLSAIKQSLYSIDNQITQLAYDYDRGGSLAENDGGGYKLADEQEGEGVPVANTSNKSKSLASVFKISTVSIIGIVVVALIVLLSLYMLFSREKTSSGGATKKVKSGGVKEDKVNEMNNNKAIIQTGGASSQAGQASQ